MSSRRYNPYYKKSKSNLKAAFEQRDVCNVVLKNTRIIAAGQKAAPISVKGVEYDDDGNQMDDTVVIRNIGTSFVNIYDVLIDSEFYENYSSMYDQVKINSIRVDISAIDWPNAKDDSNLVESGYIYPKTLNVFTAWDRSGLSETDLQFEYVYPNSKGYEGDYSGQGEDIDDDDKRFYCVVGNKITSYSSALTRRLGQGSSLNFTRYLYPESLSEKSQFVNTNNLIKQYSYNEEEDSNGYYLFDEKYSQVELGDGRTVTRRTVIPFSWNINLPTNPVASPAVSFKPTLLLAVIYKDDPTFSYDNMGLLNTSNNLKPSTFYLNFTIDVTFRGLRYSKFVK